MGPGTLLCSFCEGDLRVFGVHMPFAKITKITDTHTDTHTDGRTDGQTDIHICGDRDVISASRKNNTFLYTDNIFVLRTTQFCALVPF